MKIEQAVVAVTKRGKPVSRDARILHALSENIRFAAIASSRGYKGKDADGALFAQRAVVSLLEEATKNASATAIPDWFAATQSALQREFSQHALGASALCVMIKPDDQMVVAHAGHCRLFRFHPENPDGACLITQDHTPDHKGEETRLAETLRLGKIAVMKHGEHFPPILEEKRYLHYLIPRYGWSKERIRCTRGFGYPHFLPAVTHDPDVQTLQIQPDKTQFFALCTTGSTKAVLYAFKQIQGTLDPYRFHVEDLVEMVRTKLMEKPKGPKHDVTIIFFRISPDSADL